MDDNKVIVFVMLTIAAFLIAMALIGNWKESSITQEAMKQGYEQVKEGNEILWKKR